METRANYALIGAFTLGVITFALGFVFWFSGPSSATARRGYDIIFLGSVSGLSRGASVNFNGLRVGDVTRLALNKDDPSEVIAHIEIDKTTPIKTNTRARLEFTGLTGVASVALSGGSASAEKLEPDPTQSYPIIRADPSQFQNLLETAQRIAGQLGEIAEKTNKILDQNALSFTATVSNVEKFTGALAQNSDGIRDLMASLADVSQAAKPLAIKMTDLSVDADGLIKSIDPAKIRTIVDNVTSASARLDSVLGGVNSFLGADSSRGMSTEIGEAAKSIKRLADNLDMRLKEISGNLIRFAGPGLRQYEALAVDGRKTLDQINKTVRSLEKDPSQVIFGGKPALPVYNGP